MIVNCGTFHGGMAATTPTGSWRTMTSPSEPARVSSHGKVRAMARNASICIHGAGAWARLEKDSGEPISVEMISAMSPILPAYRFEKFWTTSIALRRAHPRPRAGVERAAGRGDGGVDVGLAALGHGRDDLLGVGRDDLDGVAGGRGGPVAVDEEGALVEAHGDLLWFGVAVRGRG